MSGPECNGQPAGNLPTELTTFVGRRDLLGQLGESLGQARLLTLTGPAGVGKTRLASRLARIRARAFSDGVWWVDLTIVSDPSLLAHTVAESVGAHHQSERPVLDALLTHLRRRELLIVMDNCEHLVDAVAEFVVTLLRDAPGVRVLATSRVPLDIPGEHIAPVPPMAVPTTAEVDQLTPVGHHDAVRLFIDRARAVGAALADEDTDAIARLVNRLDGLPLAIELVAARAAVMTPVELLDRLDDRFRLLTGGCRRATQPHHHTLAGAFAWSYELCTPIEQHLWARLAVFAGSWDLAEAEAICAGDDIDAADMLDLVEALVHQSIVTVERGHPTRYRLLETIREFGLQHLRRLDEEVALRCRHRDYYLRMAEEAAADWFSVRDRDWMSRIGREMPNIRAALNWCISQPGETDAGLSIAVALTRARAWFFAGTLAEARRWLRRLLAHRKPSPLHVQAMASGTWIALCQGDIGSAVKIAAQCHDLADRLDTDSDVVTPVLAFMDGTVTFLAGNPVAALASLESARNGFHTCGRAGDAHMAQLLHALAAGFADDPDLAMTASRQCLAEAEDRRADLAICWGQWACGLAHLRHGGELRHAAALFTAALRQQRAIGDRWGPMWGVEALAWTAAATGEHERAAVLLGGAHRLREMTDVALAGLAPLAAVHDTTDVAIRDALGPAAYTTVYERGSAMHHDEIIATALSEPAPTTGGQQAPPAAGHLTPRETEIAQLLAEDAGLTNKAIATRLVVSVRTVDSHIDHILRKLGLNSRAQIAVWATELRHANTTG